MAEAATATKEHRQVIEEEMEEGSEGSDDQHASDTSKSDNLEEKRDEFTADGEQKRNRKKGLLEQPVIQEGRRNRKTIERLTMTGGRPQMEKKTPEYQVEYKGTGVQLGHIEKIAHCIERIKSENLKPLHRVLFGRPGPSHLVKRNIRSFQGFGFGKGSAEYAKKAATVKKFPASSLKELCKILCVPSSGSKDEVIEKLMGFLIEPSKEGAMGRSLVKKRKRKSGETVGRTLKGSKQKQPSKKAAKKTDGDNDSDDNADDEESEEEESEPSKKPSETFKKSSVSTGKKSISLKKKQAAVTDSDDKSDDEPLSKKFKVAPSDEELAGLIEQLLEDANLEEVTMNKLCQQVYDRFPGIDLQPRRPFVKKKVKELLALQS